MHHFQKLTPEELANIKTWALEGVGLTEITKRLNNKITKQRVQQITNKAGIDCFAIKKQKKQKELNDRMFSKWGEKWNDKEWRRSDIYARMREKFRSKKARTYKADFTIEFGDLHFPSHCPILGIELDYYAESIQDNSPSFDRVDPSKGYVKGNVVVMSMRANRIKNNGTAEEHEKIAAFMRSY